MHLHEPNLDSKPDCNPGLTPDLNSYKWNQVVRDILLVTCTDSVQIFDVLSVGKG